MSDTKAALVGDDCSHGCSSGCGVVKCRLPRTVVASESALAVVPGRWRPVVVRVSGCVGCRGGTSVDVRRVGSAQSCDPVRSDTPGQTGGGTLGRSSDLSPHGLDDEPAATWGLRPARVPASGASAPLSAPERRSVLLRVSVRTRCCCRCDSVWRVHRNIQEALCGSQVQPSADLSRTGSANATHLPSRSPNC